MSVSHSQLYRSHYPVFQLEKNVTVGHSVKLLGRYKRDLRLNVILYENFLCTRFMTFRFSYLKDWPDRISQGLEQVAAYKEIIKFYSFTSSPRKSSAGSIKLTSPLWLASVWTISCRQPSSAFCKNWLQLHVLKNFQCTDATEKSLI